jgi:hypothetical protein
MLISAIIGSARRRVRAGASAMTSAQHRDGQPAFGPQQHKKINQFLRRDRIIERDQKKAEANP